MTNNVKTNRNWKTSARFFLLELVFYAAAVTAYFFLVLSLLANWLQGLYEQHRSLYAIVALGLIAGQGFGLEVMSRGLLGWLEPRKEN
jgi:membrane protease YdiL (CAAX protease family)